MRRIPGQRCKVVNISSLAIIGVVSLFITRSVNESNFWMHIFCSFSSSVLNFSLYLVTQFR